MFDPTRRNLLKAVALLPLAAACAGVADAAGRLLPDTSMQARFAVFSGQPGRVVSESLAGLSYETLQLADPAFFSADNHALVQLFRELSSHGVLRIGGNTSDYTVWSEYRGELPVQHTRKGGPQQPFVLKPEALRSLAGFLRATGWKLVFGVNLKIGVPAMAVELAGAVQRIVGDRLLAIQVGNEANNYEPDYAAFDAAWTPYAKAIRAAGVPIAGPDTGANTDWVIEYAKRHGKESAFISRHYYRDAAPNGSIADLLGGDAGFLAEIEQIMQAADAARLPFYLTEANSYYLGGRDGVSNVFASALWGADFMLALAQRGVAGIHFHGGTLESVEASLGHDANTSTASTDPSARRDAVTSRYSAIAGDVALGYQPRPLYYGMQLAQRFAGARMLPGRLDAGGASLTAYAARHEDTMQVALINKDATRDITVEVSGLKGCRSGLLTRLSAPSLESRSGVVFDGTGGTAGHPVTIDAHGSCHIALPRGSAACVQVNRVV